MGTERKRYHVKVNASTFEFQGAKYIYDAIKGKIGATEVTQRSSGASGARNRSTPIKAVEELRVAVPRLRLVLKRNGIGSNSAQSDQNRRTRRIDIYVAPTKFETALRTLPGTSIGSILGAGGLYIDSVVIPRRRYYR